MKFVSLPSGLIVNLEAIAFIDSLGLYPDQSEKHAIIQIKFSATYNAARNSQPMTLRLSGRDVPAFLVALEKEGVAIHHLREAMTRKKKTDEEEMRKRPQSNLLFLRFSAVCPTISPLHPPIRAS